METIKALGLSICVNALVISVALLLAEGEKRAVTLRLVAGLCMLVTAAAPFVGGEFDAIKLEIEETVELSDISSRAYSDVVENELALFLKSLGAGDIEFDIEVDTSEGAVRIKRLTLYLSQRNDAARIADEVESFVGLKPEVCAVG